MKLSNCYLEALKCRFVYRDSFIIKIPSGLNDFKRFPHYVTIYVNDEGYAWGRDFRMLRKLPYQLPFLFLGNARAVDLDVLVKILLNKLRNISDKEYVKRALKETQLERISKMLWYEWDIEDFHSKQPIYEEAFVGLDTDKRYIVLLDKPNEKIELKENEDITKIIPPKCRWRYEPF